MGDKNLQRIRQDNARHSNLTDSFCLMRLYQRLVIALSTSVVFLKPLQTVWTQSGSSKPRARSGFKLFDTLIAFLKDFFLKKLILKRKISREQKACIIDLMLEPVYYKKTKTEL